MRRDESTTVDWYELFVNDRLSRKENSHLSASATENLKSKILEFKTSGDINKSVGDVEETLLHSAVRAENLEMVKYLIELLGADPNLINGEGDRPLDVAMDSYCFDNTISNYLINRGVDLNSNRRPDTPMWRAMRWGDAELVRLLVSKGATFSAEDLNCAEFLYIRVLLHKDLLKMNIIGASDCWPLKWKEHEEVIEDLLNELELEGEERKQEKQVQEEELKCYQRTLDLYQILHSYEEVDSLMRRGIFSDAKFLPEYKNLQECFKEIGQKFTGFARKKAKLESDEDPSKNININQNEKGYGKSSSTLWAKEEKKPHDISGDRNSDDNNNNHSSKHPGL